MKYAIEIRPARLIQAGDLLVVSSTPSMPIRTGNVTRVASVDAGKWLTFYMADGIVNLVRPEYELLVLAPMEGGT